MTADHLREFAESRVEGSGYSWVSIIVTGGNGICFPGSDPAFAEYGKLDEDGSLLESVGTWMQQSDGSYTYRTVLNSPAGQALTEELLQMKLAQNPNMTAEEWAQTKSESPSAAPLQT